jgi:hypothetical protein
MRKDFIAICTPSRGTVDTMWAQHLLAFLRPRGAEMTVLNISDYDVAVARTKLLSAARAIGATHIFYLDDDTFISRDAIARLHSHGVPIVSGVCASRQTGMPSVYVEVEGGYQCLGSEVVTAVSEGKLMADPRVATGLACCLIDLNVFDNLPKMPFMYGWLDPELRRFTTEDLFFMDTARKAGYVIHVDAWVRAVHADMSIVRWDGKRAHMDPDTLWKWLDPTGENSPKALPSFQEAKSGLHSRTGATLNKPVQKGK